MVFLANWIMIQHYILPPIVCVDHIFWLHPIQRIASWYWPYFSQVIALKEVIHIKISTEYCLIQWRMCEKFVNIMFLVLPSSLGISIRTSDWFNTEINFQKKCWSIKVTTLEKYPLVGWYSFYCKFHQKNRHHVRKINKVI